MTTTAFDDDVSAVTFSHLNPIYRLSSSSKAKAWLSAPALTNNTFIILARLHRVLERTVPNRQFCKLVLERRFDLFQCIVELLESSPLIHRINDTISYYH